MAAALVGGAVLGTPWHPPTVPFIAYHSANQVAADSVQGTEQTAGRAVGQHPATLSQALSEALPNGAPEPAAMPVSVSEPMSAAAALPDLALFTAHAAPTGQLPVRLFVPPGSRLRPPTRPVSSGLLLPPLPTGAAEPTAAAHSGNHPVAHRSMHRPSLPGAMCRLFALPCHRHH
jgi:hypothetical protein